MGRLVETVEVLLNSWKNGSMSGDSGCGVVVLSL